MLFFSPYIISLASWQVTASELKHGGADARAWVRPHPEAPCEASGLQLTE